MLSNVAATPAAAAFAPGDTRYAGFWRRYAASFIDEMIVSLVVGIPLLILFAIFASGRIHSGKEPPPEILVATGLAIFILAVVGPCLYEALMESSQQEATFGKRALGIRVVDLQGRRISFGRATGRHFGKILSAMILNIGFIMAGFTKRKQALHDLMAETLVIRSR